MIILLLALLSFSPRGEHVDFDHDGDVDQSDFGLMQVALGEPCMPFSRFDLDMDGDVDTGDVEVFETWRRKAKQ